MTHDQWSAVGLSLLVASAATAGILPFGIIMGRCLARWSFRGKALVETIVNLPMVLPPVVVGYALLVLLGRRGFAGVWLHDWLGIDIVFTWKAAAIASAVMAFPFMVRSTRLAFAGVDPKLEEAARTLGAGPLETFWRVVLPLARRGIIAGVVAAFARSLGEFGATIMVAGGTPGETQTIPLAIYSAANEPGGMENSIPLMLIAIGLAMSILMVAECLEPRLPKET